MQILYGKKENNVIVDVTNICYELLLQGGTTITIPKGDMERSYYFTDPLHGVVKSVYIVNEDNTCVEYGVNVRVKINIIDNTITTINNEDVMRKRLIIHNSLQIKHGSLLEELPEQGMVVMYLQGHEKVLEIGGNIGRNSLIISSILQENNTNTNNFVVLETDKDIAKQLQENRDLNKKDFHIEVSALSKRKLIQKGWETIPSDVVLAEYKSVDTITLEELTAKYAIDFDTLVLDCEGAFYYILQDMPEILQNISLIIMENDYWNISHKEYVDSVMKKNGFYRDYHEPGGWGPCFEYFFEVWKR